MTSIYLFMELPEVGQETWTSKNSQRHHRFSNERLQCLPPSIPPESYEKEEESKMTSKLNQFIKFSVSAFLLTLSCYRLVLEDVRILLPIIISSVVLTLWATASHFLSKSRQPKREIQFLTLKNAIRGTCYLGYGIIIYCLYRILSNHVSPFLKITMGLSITALYIVEIYGLDKMFLAGKEIEL